MIQKMKKLTFLVTNKEYDGFITSLRELGVVHIEQLQQGTTSSELQEAVDLERRYKDAIAVLDNVQASYYPSCTLQPIPRVMTPEYVLSKVERLKEVENRLNHRIDENNRNIAKLGPWGDFSMKQVRELEKESGLKIGFFRISGNAIPQQWVDDYFAAIIQQEDKKTYFVTFSSDIPDISAEHIHLPESSLNSYKQFLHNDEQHLQTVRNSLLRINKFRRDVLEEGLTAAQNSRQLSKVHLSHELVAGDLLYLMAGWVRADKTEALLEYLEQSGIFYEMEEPAFEDDVPVEITNNSYTSLFEPILRMYSLPNYHDIDPSVFFAPFFMLFFGLCLGDGGYGLIVLAAGLMLTKKGNGDMQNYGKLAVWLGLATVVCGLATGTFFGINLAEQNWAFLAPLRKYFLSDQGVGPVMGYSPMMLISVALGFIQVMLGMLLKAGKAWKNYGFAYAIGTLSWFTALIVLIVLFGLPLLGISLPVVLTYILAVLLVLAVIGIFLYNNPAAYKNPITGPLINFGAGLWSAYGMATGLLGDLLSYIRLFALGLTGGVLGGVFNSLAIDMTAALPVYVRWLPFIVILLFGHGITFLLSMISAFVHPMRLTFVEFFKNADFEGGGHPYEPFKEIKNSIN